MTERILLPSRSVGEFFDRVEATDLITGLFFNVSNSASLVRSRAFIWATSTSRRLAWSFHRALLASKKRIRFLSRFSTRFDSRAFVFHLLRLVSKNLISFFSGLL
jgi:hypothetical protein